MNTRLGSNLYRAGLTAAAISVVYTINIIWIGQSGESFLPLPERYMSREEMLSSVGVGVALSLLFGGGGAAARYFVNKSAETQAAADKMNLAESSRQAAGQPDDTPG
ncbi:MAG: hypothetical protein ACI8S3_001809 [Alphaproteobacteria bacterium]|jgi:hypothetical protein